MRGQDRKGLAVLLGAALLFACSSRSADKVAVPDRAGAEKSSASEREQRRAYDGAPPTIPHQEAGAACVECHNERGMNVEGLGFAPPSPHAITEGLSSQSRCRQCHVAIETAELFVDSQFVGLHQDLRRGTRQHPLAPPRMPHPAFMRENCLACHSGPAAREEVRSPHPERERCRQCHLPILSSAEFSRQSVGQPL